MDWYHSCANTCEWTSYFDRKSITWIIYYILCEPFNFWKLYWISFISHLIFVHDNWFENHCMSLRGMHFVNRTYFTDVKDWEYLRYKFPIYSLMKYLAVKFGKTYVVNKFLATWCFLSGDMFGIGSISLHHHRVLLSIFSRMQGTLHIHLDVGVFSIGYYPTLNYVPSGAARTVIVLKNTDVLDFVY